MVDPYTNFQQIGTFDMEWLYDDLSMIFLGWCTTVGISDSDTMQQT